MKPDFALTLSFQGIGLLYRGAPGWQVVGDVPLDSPDLNAALADLRTRAQAFVPGPVLCKLIIPDEQIKYLDLEADGDPEAAVRAALDGATPYAVDDLAYDWSAQDGRIHVAAVALETLTEAEAFAAEHDFAPVCFAAMPPDGTFEGEPFFGATRQAGQHLTDGAQITRDDDAIKVVGLAVLPRPVAQKAAADSTSARAAEKEPVTPASPTDSTKADPVDAKDPAAKPTKSATADTPAPASVQAPAKASKTPATDAPATFASIRARRDDLLGTAPPLAGQPRLSSLDGAIITASAKVTPEKAPDIKADKGVEKDAAHAPSLPSPGGEALNPPPHVAKIAASLRPDPEARLERGAGPASVLASAKSGALSFFSRRKSGAKPAKPVGAKADKVKAGKGKTGKAQTDTGKTAAVTTAEDERQRMTVFGARQQEVGGKPRFLGLILTAVLLLFLVGVAAWASLFLEEGLSRLFGPSDDIRLTEAPAEDGTADTADAEDPIAAVPQVQIDPAPAQGDDFAALEPEITPLPQSDIAALPNTPESLSPSEALARYAATGIWQMAPPAPDIPAAQTDLDGLYQVSLDPSVARPEVSTRQDTGPFGRMDVRPETPLDPPPPGVLFDFDNNGFVRATPEGAMTPQGVRVFAGRPVISPPDVMKQAPPTTGSMTPSQPETDVAAAETVDPETEATETGAIETGTTATTDTTQVVVLDPTLATTRPRLRPGTETPEGEADTPDTAEADAPPAGDPAMATLRPRLRPASVSAQAATLRSTQGASATPLVDTAAVDRALAEAEEAQVDEPDLDDGEPDADAFDNAQPQAVSASLVPLKRPDNFDAIVKQSRTEAAATPVAAAQAMQPSLPSSASVAKQATEKNAINLRQVNLIGVYGTPASRRALVRLGNGRYKKVQVGDSLDGGQVAAIGDSELRYVKRGRAVILQMPKG